MQAAAVSVNGVDLPLLHPLWLAAVQSLLPTVKVNAPKKTDRQDRAALALLAQAAAVVLDDTPASAVTRVLSSRHPAVWALVLVSANPAPLLRAEQWLDAILAPLASLAPLPPLALLYWAFLAARCAGGGGAAAAPPDPSADALTTIQALLRCSASLPAPAHATASTGGVMPTGGSDGGAEMLDAARQPAPIINIEAVDTMRAVMRDRLKPTPTDAALTHATLVLVAVQTCAAACAALHAAVGAPCGATHIAPFAATDMVTGAAKLFPAAAACALADAATKGAQTLHCTAVSLQVNVLRPLAECVRHCLRQRPALAGSVYMEAFVEHLEAACGTPRYSTLQTTPEGAALDDHLHKGVKAPVPQAAVVHDLYLGPWPRLLAQAQGTMIAAVRKFVGSSSGSSPAARAAADTVEACMQGATGTEFLEPDVLGDACRTALYALMDLRAWGEYETLVLQNWDACPLSARKWQGLGPAPGTTCPLQHP
jgi:hypothetical protein